MSIPIEPPAKERGNSIYSYVYSCPKCKVPQTAPTYNEPIVDQCINTDCETFFVIPEHPTKPNSIEHYSSENEATEKYNELTN